MSSLTDQLLTLSVEERLRIVEFLCESLDDEAADLPVPEWLEAELDRRKAAHKHDPNSSIPWEDARERLRQLYGESRESPARGRAGYPKRLRLVQRRVWRDQDAASTPRAN